MRVLSLWEPWATLMRLKLKRFETRDWAAAPGVTAIHAAKKHFNPSDWDPEFIAQLRDDNVDLKALGYGCVVCIVDFTKFHRTEMVRDRLSERERRYGNYEDGRRAWESEYIRGFDEPIPLVGHQGFFGWPEGDRYLNPQAKPAEDFGPLFAGGGQ